MNAADPITVARTTARLWRELYDPWQRCTLELPADWLPELDATAAAHELSRAMLLAHAIGRHLHFGAPGCPIVRGRQADAARLLRQYAASPAELVDWLRGRTLAGPSRAPTDWKMLTTGLPAAWRDRLARHAMSSHQQIRTAVALAIAEQLVAAARLAQDGTTLGMQYAAEAATFDADDPAEVDQTLAVYIVPLEPSFPGEPTRPATFVPVRLPEGGNPGAFVDALRRPLTGVAHGFLDRPLPATCAVRFVIEDNSGSQVASFLTIGEPGAICRWVRSLAREHGTRQKARR